MAITTLGEHPLTQTARVKNASGGGLGLVVETAISPGSAVRVELENAIILGEAMYCRPAENGHFVGVQLEQMLRGLRKLRRSVREFVDEPEERRSETR